MSAKHGILDKTINSVVTPGCNAVDSHIFDKTSETVSVNANRGTGTAEWSGCSLSWVFKKN